MQCAILPFRRRAGSKTVVYSSLFFLEREPTFQLRRSDCHILPRELNHNSEQLQSGILRYRQYQSLHASPPLAAHRSLPLQAFVHPTVPVRCLLKHPAKIPIKRHFILSGIRVACVQSSAAVMPHRHGRANNDAGLSWCRTSSLTRTGEARMLCSPCYLLAVSLIVS